MILKSIRNRQKIRSARRKMVNDARLLVKNVKGLSKSKPIDMMKAIQKHMLVIAEMNELIAIYLDSNYNANTKTGYLVSSLFLRESFELLNKREVESLHFVTGPEIGETKVLDKIVDFRLEKQSAVYAKADTSAVRKALIYLNRYAYKLYGCFHIHPGNGAASIFPSSTDMTLDRLLHQGGYECIGAIFSRDGYVRFFSSDEFEINIYGNGVEKVNEKLYRLVKVN